jgi:hypothetical protein
MENIEEILGGNASNGSVDLNDIFSLNARQEIPIQPKVDPPSHINSSLMTLLSSLPPAKQPLFIELSQLLQKKLISHEDFTQRARTLLDPNFPQVNVLPKGYGISGGMEGGYIQGNHMQANLAPANLLQGMVPSNSMQGLVMSNNSLHGLTPINGMQGGIMPGNFMPPGVVPENLGFAEGDGLKRSMETTNIQYCFTNF